MPADLENKFLDVEKQILTVRKNYQELAEKYKELSREYVEMKEQLNEEKKVNQVLAEENKNIKLYSAISGNAAHNRLMKNHINRLMKEVDFCIAELQNTGL